MFTAFRVGIFIVLALIILAVGIFLIGNKDFLFSSTYVLKSEFATVGGSNNGAEVRIGGIHEGTVKRIDLPSQPDGKMTVVMNLRNPTRNVIKKDSVAAIKTEGVLGDKYMEISFGSQKGEQIQNGDTIRSEKSSDVTEQAEAMAGEARTAIAAFRDNMEALQHNFFLRGFFEKRGYNEASELKRDAIARLPIGRPTKKFECDAGEVFDKPDNAKLKNKKQLEEAGKYLEQTKFGLAIVTSSEALGDSEDARTLTEARAKVVRDYLVQNFKLDDTHVKTIGFGKNKEGEESPKVAILIYPARARAKAAPNSAPSNP